MGTYPGVGAEELDMEEARGGRVLRVWRGRSASAKLWRHEEWQGVKQFVVGGHVWERRLADLGQA